MKEVEIATPESIAGGIVNGKGESLVGGQLHSVRLQRVAGWAGIRADVKHLRVAGSGV